MSRIVTMPLYTNSCSWSVSRASAFCLLVLFSVYYPFALAEGYKLSIGAEYISGEYGGDQPVDEWYIPVTGKYITDHYIFRLTVPYVRLTAPAGTTVGNGAIGQIVKAGSGVRTTEQGLGDIIAGITLLDLLSTGSSSDLSLDVTGKVKFATADEEKGLGTGENDYTIQAELFRFYRYYAIYGVAGYIYRGEPPGINLNNTWFGLVGVKFDITQQAGAGLDLYFREASSFGTSGQNELTLFLDHKVNRENKLRTYFIQGLGDGSPDWGMGVMLSTTL